MDDGWWLRYAPRFGLFPLGFGGDHARWVKDEENAASLGLGKTALKTLRRFNPERDRIPLLLFVLRRSRVIRARGHGTWVAFEFWNRSNKAAFAAIRKWGRAAGAGDVLLLRIVNLKTGMVFTPLWLPFDAAVRQGKRIRSAGRVVRSFMRGSNRCGRKRRRHRMKCGNASNKR